MSRTIVVGDIHGCYDELQRLLAAVRLTAGDRLVALGDIVDRGPDSEKVLELFSSRPNTISLMGNHERKHVRSSGGEVRPALSQLITRAQLGGRYRHWVAYMESLPRHLELEEAVLVHGFFEPGVSLEGQRDEVVIGTMSGERRLERTLSAPWYESYDGAKPLVVGHRDYLEDGTPLVLEGRVYGIDTACYRGGRLTALVIPGFELISVPSGGDHWTELKRRYRLVAGSDKLDLDLDWATLSDLAAAAEDDLLPDALRAAAVGFAGLSERCERLTRGVLAEVERRHRSILADLERQWARWTDRERSARYAEQAKGQPCAHLLFVALRGSLDAEEIRLVTKTPRELSKLAAQLGVEVGSDLS